MHNTRLAWQRLRRATHENFREVPLKHVRLGLYYLVRLVGYHQGDRYQLRNMQQDMARAFISGVKTRVAQAGKGLHGDEGAAAFEDFEDEMDRANRLAAARGGGDADEAYESPDSKLIAPSRKGPGKKGSRGSAKENQDPQRQ